MCTDCLVTDKSGVYVTLDFFVCCGVSAIIVVRNKVVISVIWKIGNSVNYKFILDTPFSVMHARVAAILVKSPSSFSFSKLNKLKCELYAQTIASKIKFNINPLTQINQCAFVLMV